MEIKVCSKCREEKPIQDFPKKKDGHRARCKKCTNEDNKAYRNKYPERCRAYIRKYAMNNSAKEKERHKKYYQENRESIREKYRKYYQENRDFILEKNRLYFENHPEKCAKYAKKFRSSEKWKEYKRRYNINRWNNDIEYKLLNVLRSRINDAVKRKHTRKAHKTEELVGCSVNWLKQHLESQFTEDMSWDNYGYWGWHIDHIRPCDSFDLTDPEQQKECFHYTNLQPLWWYDNLRKSNRLDWIKPANDEEE